MLPLVLLTLAALTTGVKLPSAFEKCDYKKPDLGQCLHKATISSLRLLGKQALKSVGLSKIEPLEVTEFTVSEGTGPVGVRQNFKNVKLYGISKAEIGNFQLNLDPTNLAMNVTGIMLPDIRFQAQYNLNGKILLLPIKGEGDCTILFKNLECAFSCRLEPVKNNGEVYLKIASGNLHFPAFEHIHYQFDNLFDGDKTLGDEINKVLNDNWAEIFNDVKSGYETLFYEIIANLVSGLLERVPVPDLIDNAPL